MTQEVEHIPNLQEVSELKNYVNLIVVGSLGEYFSFFLPLYPLIIYYN